MILLTKALAKKLPELRSTQRIPLADKLLVIKFFTPWSNWTWYGVEYDPETRIFFGWVKGPEPEWGYFSLDEIESVRGPFGLKIERDRGWRPIKSSELKS